MRIKNRESYSLVYKNWLCVKVCILQCSYMKAHHIFTMDIYIRTLVFKRDNLYERWDILFLFRAREEDIRIHYPMCFSYNILHHSSTHNTYCLYCIRYIRLRISLF